MSKILIIEDEEAIRRVLVKILTEESKDYQVFEASDGLAGVEAFKKDDFDLILCDIKMPKMDGVEVLEAAKKIKPEIPIVMIQCYSTPLNMTPCHSIPFNTTQCQSVAVSSSQ